MSDSHKDLIEESILKCRSTLTEAKRIARQNRDVEAMIVIADRFALFAKSLKDLDKNGTFMLGFSPNEKEDEDE